MIFIAKKIESLSKNKLGHGHAVGFGLNLANFISYRMGYLDKKVFYKIYNSSYETFDFEKITKNFTFSKTWSFQNNYFGWNYEYFDNINDPLQTTNIAWQIDPNDPIILHAENVLQQKMQEIQFKTPDIPAMCPGTNAFNGCLSQCSNSGSYAQCHKGDIKYNGKLVGSCGSCRAKPRALAYLQQLGCGNVHDNTCNNKIKQRANPDDGQYTYVKPYKY